MVEIPKDLVRLLRDSDPVSVESTHDDSRVSIWFEDDDGQRKSVAFWGVDHISVQEVRTVDLPQECDDS